MKKFSKMAVLSALVGILCMSVYAAGLGSLKNKAAGAVSKSIPSPDVKGPSDPLGNRWRNPRPDISKGELEALDFERNGVCHCWDGSAKGKEGKWTGGLKSGEKVSVTTDGKTYSGTITSKGGRLMVTLGALGYFEKE